MNKKLFATKYTLFIIVGAILLVSVILFLAISPASPLRSSIAVPQNNPSSIDSQQTEVTPTSMLEASAASNESTSSSTESTEPQQSTANSPQAEQAPTSSISSSRPSASPKPRTSTKAPSATTPQGKPGYTDRGTQVSRINDTTTHVTYRITFNITPNQYFGAPMIELVMYHYDVCVNSEATLRKTFRYNGNNSFFVDCVIDKSRPEARLGSQELYASLNLTAQNGEGITGGIGGFRYLLPAGYSE